MFSYIVRRTVQGLFVMLLLSFVCFSLMTLMPGDPVELMIASNPRMSAADVVRLKAMYGLDQPLVNRYWNWLSDVASGNLGYSRTYRVPVADLLGERLLNTLFLSLSSLTLAVLIGIPVGVFTALRKGGKMDYIANLFAFAGQSIPQFWLGIIVIMVFAVWLGWFPAGGTQSTSGELSGFAAVADRLYYAFLPICVFTVAQVAAYVRLTRGSMLEVLNMDYMRTAKAKGLSRSRIIWVHGFRNAVMPLITILALGLSGVFSGAIITEGVFAYQGVGKLVYDSIISNDFNVAMIAFTITVGMVVLMNLIADIAYAAVDPRVSYK